MDKSLVRNELTSPVWGLGNIQRELDTLLSGFGRLDRRAALEFAPIVGNIG